jgi:methyltransferase
MGLSLPASIRWYLALVGAVAVLRFVELAVSARNRRALASEGAAAVPERHFRWMATLHTAILIGAPAEVVWLRRPLVMALAVPSVLALIAATCTRWWVIRTLGRHWNVGIMDSPRHDVVDGGPYRWLRHPNYAAVFVELLALPLVHTAWITAVIGGALHVLVLRARVSAEDRMLFSSAEYVARMGMKPRFLPTLSRAPEGRRG